MSKRTPTPLLPPWQPLFLRHANQASDHKNVLFHVGVDDYFGTLAAVLSLFKQQLETASTGMSDEQIVHMLNGIQNDLLFLQKDYRIVEKGS